MLGGSVPPRLEGRTQRVISGREKGERGKGEEGELEMATSTVREAEGLSRCVECSCQQQCGADERASGSPRGGRASRSNDDVTQSSWGRAEMQASADRG